MPSPTRRQVLATVGSASAALTGCLSRVAPSGDLGEVEGTWPMAGRDAGHTRRVAAGPADPRTVWTAELDRVRAAGTPSVVDGRLYVPVDAVSDRARHRHRIHALAASTGDERWRVPLRSEPNAPPAVSGDSIVVTARRSTDRGRIVCFQKRYGDEDWLFDTDARLTAPPTIESGVVYVPDWSGYVHALSVPDGSVRWSRQVDGGERARTFTEPVAIRDGTVYLGSQSGATGVVALDAKTGETRWTASTRAVTGGPIVNREGLVVRSHRRVIAFDTDGTRRWSFGVLEGTARPVAVDTGRVYVPARETLYAINWSGERAWTYEPSGGRVGTPTVAGDTVLVRGTDRLTALSREDGEELWRASADGSGRAVATPEAIFLSGGGGNVLALGET